MHICLLGCSFSLWTSAVLQSVENLTPSFLVILEVFVAWGVWICIWVFINVMWVKGSCVVVLTWKWVSTWNVGGSLVCGGRDQWPLLAAMERGMSCHPGWVEKVGTKPVLSGTQGGKNSNDQGQLVFKREILETGSHKKSLWETFLDSGNSAMHPGTLSQSGSIYLLLNQHCWGSLQEPHCCQPLTGGAWDINQVQHCSHKMLVSIPVLFLFIVPLLNKLSSQI